MKSVQRYGWPLVLLVLAGCARGVGSAGVPTPEVEREAEPAPTLVGAVLPRSGSDYLARYGDLVLQGIEVALDEYGETSRHAVHLEVIDDRGDPELASAAIDSLERRGAAAVIGPLLPTTLLAAVRARGDDPLVVIGPLASEAPASPGVYALNAPDVLGAEALAAYAIQAGLHRVALLYPRTAEQSRQARAFAAALVEQGGAVVADVPYDAGTTTFATHLNAIAAAEPDAVFVPAPERDVHQIAPQLTYYGLAGAGVRVLGGESWTVESVRNRVAARYLDGVVAVTPLLPSSAEVAWSDFVTRYERTHRRSLDNPFPALGYDAMRLILSALAGEALQPDDVARRLEGVHDLRGATGVLSVQAGAIIRRPFLVRVEQGELVPVSFARNDAAEAAPGAGWRNR